MDTPLAGNIVNVERVALAALSIGTTATALRLWTRYRILRTTGVEEWIMLAAWLCFVGYNGALYAGFQDVGAIISGGKSVASLEMLVRVTAVLYVTTLALVKISVAYFFLHIYSVHTTQRRLLYGVAGFIALFSVITVVALGTSCRITSVVPHNGQFCAETRAISGVVTTWSVLNATSDLLYMFLAMHAMRNTRIAWTHKVWCIFLLILTLSGGVVSFARVGIVTSPRANTFGPWVFTVVQLTVAEICIVITAANMICLKPLLSVIHNLKWFGTTSRADSKTTLQKKRETIWGPISPKRPLYDTLSSFRSETTASGGFTGLGVTSWAKAEYQPNCLLQISLPMNGSKLSLTKTTESRISLPWNGSKISLPWNGSKISLPTSESKISLPISEVEQIQKPAPIARTISNGRRGPRPSTAGSSKLPNLRFSTFEPLWEGLEFEEHDPSALERGEKQGF